MKYQASITGALAALALIIAPGFAAHAADTDTSPDVNINAPATANDIETPDTGVEDDAAEVETSAAEDVETPDIEDVEVEAPEHGD